MSDLLERLTNLAVRAPDLDAEIAFLEAFGASAPIRTQRMHEGVKVERISVQLAGTRLTLFQRATYDDRLVALGEPRVGGMAHVAFAVPADARLREHLTARSIEPLIPTFETSPGRFITYYRSPNGTVLETHVELREPTRS